jgi:hypothetical protein
MVTLEENSIIVIDNASYHSRKIEKIPSATRKNEVQEWLRSKNIPWAQIKVKVARKNVTFKFQDVKNLFDAASPNVTTENWVNATRHVKFIRYKY